MYRVAPTRNSLVQDKNRRLFPDNGSFIIPDDDPFKGKRRTQGTLQQALALDRIFQVGVGFQKCLFHAEIIPNILSMTPAAIVSKLWNFCNGMSYDDYVEQLNLPVHHQTKPKFT